MSTKFLKLEDVKLNETKKADLSVVSFFGGIDNGKMICLSYRESDSLAGNQLSLTRKEVLKLNKALTRWLDGKPLEEVD